jgi:hypothetical protein
MGIRNFIQMLFGADPAAVPPDTTKLDGTTKAALARSSNLGAGKNGESAAAQTLRRIDPTNVMAFHQC